MQRLRITYRVSGPQRYTSHLDQGRVWERAIRRAGLPLLYSAGFNPRPRIQIAAALPVGFAADGEWLDLWLGEPVDLQAAGKALAAALPDGLSLVALQEVDLAESALPNQVRGADYAVVVDTPEPSVEAERRVAELLAAASLPRERRGKPYDLRPLVEELRVSERGAGGVTLSMRLSAREGATGRPEEVLDALALAGGFYRVCRCRLRGEESG